MDKFAESKPAERQPYFEETAARRDSTTTAVEKDFWICWTLKHLFTLEAIPHSGSRAAHRFPRCSASLTAFLRTSTSRSTTRPWVFPGNATWLIHFSQAPNAK